MFKSKLTLYVMLHELIIDRSIAIISYKAL